MVIPPVACLAVPTDSYPTTPSAPRTGQFEHGPRTLSRNVHVSPIRPSGILPLLCRPALREAACKLCRTYSAGIPHLAFGASFQLGPCGQDSAPREGGR